MSYKPAFWLGWAAMIAFVALIGVWGTQARISGAVLASGQVVVQNNRQVVQHPDGGVVKTIIARDGDSVSAGDVLFQLDETFLSSERTILADQLEELKARRFRYAAEEEGRATYPADEVNDVYRGQSKLFSTRLAAHLARLQNLDEQIKQSHAEITGIDAQLNAMQRQLELVQEELNDAQDLFSRGLTKSSTLLALRRESARLDGNIGSLNADKARVAQQIALYRLEKTSLDTQRREDAMTALRDVNVQIAELSQRLQALDQKLERLDIRAPVSGKIFASTVFAENSVITAAAPLLYIIPQDQELRIKANVAATDIDQTYVGQVANLRFTALDQRKINALDGVVERIAADVTVDPLADMAVFEVDIALSNTAIQSLSDQSIGPGMPVEAFLITQDRTPFAFLVQPLTDYINRAFRG
ncbi:MAG: HlyD family type I secretion periplasmic adaptor subunit [Planktomarina sp.]